MLLKAIFFQQCKTHPALTKQNGQSLSELRKYLKCSRVAMQRVSWSTEKTGTQEITVEFGFF